MIAATALLAACGARGPAFVAEETTADVGAGLASCLSVIGRSDVILDPDAPMSDDEIARLLGCTADRASQ